MSDHDTTTIYHFDPETLVFTGSGLALTGPAGDVQLPAFSSTIAPGDIPAGKVARAASIECTEWVLVDDNRTTPVYRTADGTSYHLGDPLADGVVWGGLGDIPVTLTTVPKPAGHYAWNGSDWVFDLPAARAAAAAAVDEKRDEVLASPFAYDGKSFSADAAAISHIASMAQLATVAKLAGQPYTAIWSTIDGTSVELDADGMVALAMAAATRQPSIYQVAAQLKSRIAEAQDEAALAAIVWPQ
ncbi:DUF4376 domain-containing protein [Burkholderia cenocepacia]|uniref:DUF4376 domain-containing protein n=2 Tax=Burkholderia cenocepacia TaxID=95486 RepID=UPI0013E0BA48|nr:DUF4376 domain-containing protein [Burkholderia cenocepacia]MCW3583832.1 DUF4376 domain-containing protein [Burkholderia cenocepacia]MCW3629349.1 DUF4376 domain-containing protein [Burkholderia cenocepacia]NGO94292.1 hypothetical protein [Burkholderia cenocepacia]